MLARDVMTVPVVSVHPEDPVRTAAKIMSERRISALPVVDEANKVVGIVSEGDLFRRAEMGTRSHRSWWLELLSDPVESDLNALRETAHLVSAVMTRDVVTIDPDMPLAEVAAVLAKRHIKRVPVVVDGRIAGIVSRADLVRVLASTPVRAARVTADDRALRINILAALDTLRSMNSQQLNVIVEGGEVSVWGALFSEDRRRPILETIKGVPGVKTVHDHLGVLPAWYGAE